MTNRFECSRLPLLVAVALLGFATLFPFAIRLAEPLAISPWEPALSMEAVRLNAGLPIYETAHATHMYGPVLTIVLAAIFQVAGLSLLAARAVFSLIGIALAAFLSATICGRANRTFWPAGFLLFLAINLRTNFIFTSAQPDCLAALLGTAGLLLWIRRGDKLLPTVCSVALFVGAALTKQTAAAFALIPALHVIWWERPLSTKRAAHSLVPAASIALLFVAIRFGWPAMFEAMVTVPASIKVYPDRAFAALAVLFLTFPILFIALASIFGRGRRVDSTNQWICSAIVVLVPVSAWTIAKSGGGLNSLLFGYLAVTALFVSQLPFILRWINELSRNRRLWAASLLAVSILFSFLAQLRASLPVLFLQYGDAKYASVIQLVARLPAPVLCPQDPTITYKARKRFERSLFFELDTHALDGNWPEELPAALQEEVRRAAFVIEVNKFIPVPQLSRFLTASGFQRTPVPELGESAYVLWSRSVRSSPAP
ncbi:MAG: hypothetical protein ABI871_00020 [Chthoniobacterales bacterium]